MAEANRSKPAPVIVWVLIVVGLNAAIHHRLSPPGLALSQTIAAALWSRSVPFARRDTATTSSPTDRPS